MSSKPEALKCHFDDIAQQQEADVMGMWVFLVTEVLFFGGLFLVYTVYRWSYPEAFMIGSGQLDMPLGALNTGILLTSSLSMALADHFARRDHWKAAQWMLAVTLLLGWAFLCIKGVEYYHEFQDGLVPFLGDTFNWPGDQPANGRLFFNIYFAMTGLHALHLLIGCGLVAVLVAVNHRSSQPERLRMQIRTTGLYWHFVDIVWVFLFPLLYLVR